jgi:hypothetical protein
MSPFVRRNDRQEIRRAIVMSCQIVREADFRLIADKAIDVSPDGMLVATDVDLEPGENVFVSFYMPLGRSMAPSARLAQGAADPPTELGLWFDTEASVARVVRGRRPGDKGKGIALRFKSLSRVKRLILRSRLRKIPPPVPRRSQRIDWTATVVGIAS